MASQMETLHAGVWAGDLPMTNGHGTARRLPIKTRTVELDGDYAGWTATVRTNAPFSHFLKLASLTNDDGQAALAALAEIYGLLPKLIFAWNFVDEEGQPLPCNETGFAALPADLMVQLIAAINQGGDDGPKG